MSINSSLIREGAFFLKLARNKSGLWDICANKGRQVIKLAGTGESDPEKARVRLKEYSAKHTQLKEMNDAPVLEVMNDYFLKYAHALPSEDTVRYAIRAVRDYLYDPELKRHPMVSEMGPRNQVKLIRGLRSKMRHQKRKDPASPVVRAVGDWTIHRYLGVVWSAFGYSKDNEGLRSFPSRISNKHRDWKPKFKKSRRLLTLKEVASLMNKAATSEHRWRYMVLSFLGRPTAVLQLMVEQIDLLHGLATMKPEDELETNKRKPTIPLPPAILEWLRIWIAEDAADHTRSLDRTKGRIITYKGRALATKTKTFFRNMVRCLDPTITPRMLRRFLATWMAAKGVDKRQRACFMGHEKPDGNTQDVYVEFEPEFLRDAAMSIQALFETLAPMMTVRSVLPPVRVPTLRVVGAAGFEPATSAVSRQRSTTELRAQFDPAEGVAWQLLGNAQRNFSIDQTGTRPDHHHVKVMYPEINQAVRLKYRVKSGTNDQ